MFSSLRGSPISPRPREFPPSSGSRRFLGRSGSPASFCPISMPFPSALSGSYMNGTLLGPAP